MIYGNNIFVAGAFNGNAFCIMSSKDSGLKWIMAKNQNGFDNINFEALSYFNGIYVAKSKKLNYSF